MKNRRTIIKAALLALLVLLALPSLAFAETHGAAPLNAAQEIAVFLIQVLGAALGIVAIWAVRKGIKWIEAKTAIDLAVEQEALAENIILKGIGYAEEQAHKAAKRKARSLEMDEKKEAAAQFAIDLAKAQGGPAWLEDKIRDLLEAKLGEMRRGERLPLPVNEGA